MNIQVGRTASHRATSLRHNARMARLVSHLNARIFLRRWLYLRTGAGHDLWCQLQNCTRNPLLQQRWRRRGPRLPCCSHPRIRVDVPGNRRGGRLPRSCNGVSIARQVSKSRDVSKREVELLARSVALRNVVVVGRKTNPPAFGVYCVEAFASGRRLLQYRVGNHSVRQAELTRKFGAAALLALFESRADADEFRHLLANGRTRPPAIVEA